MCFKFLLLQFFLGNGNFSPGLLLWIYLSKTYYLIDVPVTSVVVLHQNPVPALQLLVMLLNIVECKAEKEKEEKRVKLYMKKYSLKILNYAKFSRRWCLNVQKWVFTPLWHVQFITLMLCFADLCFLTQWEIFIKILTISKWEVGGVLIASRLAEAIHVSWSLINSLQPAPGAFSSNVHMKYVTTEIRNFEH